MNRRTCRATLGLTLMLLACLSRVALVSGQTSSSQSGKPGLSAVSASELLKKLNELVEQNNKLEKQNRELMDQIEALRQLLSQQAGAAATAGTSQQEGEPTTGVVTLNATKPAEGAATGNLQAFRPRPMQSRMALRLRLPRRTIKSNRRPSQTHLAARNMVGTQLGTSMSLVKVSMSRRPSMQV